MTHILYADFLTNKKTYNLAQGAWNRLLNSLLKTYGYTYTPYINQIQNGKKDYSGNPIYSAYIPAIGRAIRIIQVAPEEKGNDISAWIDDIELNEQFQNQKTAELVLDLKLSRAAKKTAKDLIGKWIAGQLDTNKLDKILDSSTN